eukprot:m.96529 g.96529  ORF g.96529 m.96529 type:complete len:497 (+) comp13549_c0_seq6:68-1558(+)
MAASAAAVAHRQTLHQQQSEDISIDEVAPSSPSRRTFSVLDNGKDSEDLVVMVANNDAEPLMHRMTLNPTEPQLFVTKVKARLFSGEKPPVNLIWSYADGEEFDPLDLYDLETLRVFCSCEIVAQRPTPLLRVRLESQDYSPLLISNATLSEQYTELKKALKDEDEEDESKVREWPTSSNPLWQSHYDFIKPKDEFTDDEVSDCIPWLRRSTFLIKFLEAFSIIVILVSVAIFCIETLPQYRLNDQGEDREDPVQSLYVTEAICVGFFTVEYLWRFFFAPYKWKFVKHPMQIIDIIAILPFYISLGLAGDGGSQLTILRILRLSRVSKIFRHSSRLQDMVRCIVSTKSELVLFFLITSVATVLFASAIFFAEKDEPDTDFISIPASFWWALVTMTTVGYGDMSPSSVAGKIIGGLCASLGVILLAIPAGIFISEFMKLHEERQLEKAVSDEVSLASKLEHHLNEALGTIQKLEKAASFDKLEERSSKIYQRNSMTS